jgi:hypothetical protein
MEESVSHKGAGERKEKRAQSRKGAINILLCNGNHF